MSSFTSFYRIIVVSLIFVLGYRSSNAQLYYKDVAPVFIANCTSCHHDGGLAFSLSGFSNVLSHVGAIPIVVQNNSMPPWPADPSYKHYVKERVLSTADKTLLTNWISQGALAGDTSIAAQAPAYGNAQLNGTPDMVLELPKFTSNASSQDMYICVNVPVNMTQDRYIRAFEFIPGNQQLIHHAVITIDTTATAVDDYSGGCYNFQGQINIGDFAPGMGPTVLPGVSPAKFGFRLKAGSKMSFQLHIPHNTAGLKDSSVLNLFFYPMNEPNVRPMFFETALQNWNFYIAPNSTLNVNAKYPTGSAGVPVDISLYGAFPHSHQTCTSIINFAYNNSDTIPLVRIPKWDFHWQGQYTFPNLVKLPQGYHLFARHGFDNTINNPNTPDPNTAVLPGTDTDDEMLFDSYLYTLYQAGDEFINIDSILAADTLFYPTYVGAVENTIQQLQVYPNPVHQETRFTYQLRTAQFVTLRILDLQGNVVQQIFAGIQAAGPHEIKWNLAERPSSGIYMYQLQAGQHKSSGKLMVQ